MNEMRFDDLTRTLSAVLTGGTTRRAISRYLGGLALAGSLATPSLPQAGAMGGHKKKATKKRSRSVSVRALIQGRARASENRRRRPRSLCGAMPVHIGDAARV